MVIHTAVRFVCAGVRNVYIAASQYASGRRVSQYEMKLCVNYHDSNFWADPSKQMCPKAWEGMEIQEKSEALYAFTTESLRKIQDAGRTSGWFRSAMRLITAWLGGPAGPHGVSLCAIKYALTNAVHFVIL